VSDLFASSSPEVIAASKHGIAYYYVKFGGRIVFSALLYLYFFKRSVRDYFELAHVRRWKIVLIQLAICAAIVLVVAVWLIAIE
jgi:cytochrome c oxidase subunit IV